MKAYVVATAICILASHLLPQPNKSPSKDKSKPADHAGETITLSYNQESAQKAETPKTSPPHWYAFLKRPDWWLVIVAALTAGFICWQSRETRHAAQAAMQSIRLQEARMRQWVDIEDVDVKSAHFPDNAVEADLKLSFQIVNPTEMVLTLREIMITVFDETFSVSLEYTLPPDHGYPMSVDVPIGGESFREYIAAILIIPVTGLISFEDAFRNMQHHGFGFNCRCSRTLCELAVYEGPIPKKGNTQNKGEKAN